MLGYRRGRLKHLGKLAARLDDALNLLPARLAAAALVAGAGGAGGAGRGAGRGGGAGGGGGRPGGGGGGGGAARAVAGRPRAAMAGALGVTLAKRGHYRLGA